jgi:hypothetical protein
MKFIYIFVIMLLVHGCGYIPSAKYSRAVVGENISTSVVISAIDPENTVIIKDAVDSAIIEVFHASLVSKENSNTHLVLSLGNPSYSAIQYDSDGFIIAYRTRISLSILRNTEGEDTKSYSASGTYDFSVTANAIISDKQRFDAIKFSSVKAIRSFVAQVSSEGARKEVINNSDKLEQSAVTSEKLIIQSNEKVIKIPEIERKVLSKPTTSVRTRLDDLDKAYEMKKDGLLSDEEFKAMKNDILTK